MLKHYTLLALILVIGQLAWAQSGSHSLLDHTNIEISTTAINTQTSDIGPAIVANELWFSAYTDRDVRNILAGRTDKRFYKTFAVPIDQEGNITMNERRMIADFNTEFHEGPVAYSERTGELFVTLSNTVNVEVEVDGLVVKRKKMRLRLVVAQLIDNLWKITHEMPFNDPVYSVGHPSVTQTGDTLFFTSDLAGQTIGKTDIYMVTRQNGQWGTPKNLGSTINTSGDEMFPYFHHTGALIFASNGHKGGKGGLDLYYSQLTPEGFTPVKAIEALNTPHDDFGLMINQQGNLGYFVSNKPGNTGDDDIYKIRISKKLMAINGLVTNVNTGTAIAQAKVQLSDCNNQVIKTVDSDEQGQFRFENLPMACYKITASKENYTTDTKTVTNDEQVNLQLKPSKELIVNVLDYDTRTPIPHASLLINKKAFTVDNKAQLKMQLTNETKLEILASAEGYLNQTTNINVESDGIHHHNILLMKKEMNKTFVLENIYYDLDKWNLLPASEQELDKLVQIMKENPSIVVELGSHTDSRGSDAYNQTLSQRRSESAVSYIITKGIPRAKIIAKGYGESQLVNRCANGVACSDEEHRKNRRTEFKIIALD